MIVVNSDVYVNSSWLINGSVHCCNLEDIKRNNEEKSSDNKDNMYKNVYKEILVENNVSHNNYNVHRKPRIIKFINYDQI